MARARRRESAERAGDKGSGWPVLSCWLPWGLVLALCLDKAQLAPWSASAAKRPAEGEALSSLDDRPTAPRWPTDVRQLSESADHGTDHGTDHSTGTEHSGNATESGNHDEHSSHHQQEALLFMFNALVVGTIVAHIASLPRFKGVQQTVVVFLIGLISSVIMDLVDTHDSTIVKRSYSMWMDINPHLLLFTMLPALLAGDAMTIDTSVVRRVLKQCLYLAGPGVLIGSFLTALFLYGYMNLVSENWTFPLCLTVGSILAATDPVAVVGLLKELGASPTLTIQIQGESLLNDGTAIVLFLIAYDITSGIEMAWSDVLEALVTKAFLAVLLGYMVGWFFMFWIRLSSDRFNHSSSMIQIALTLCCAYWSFILAEGVCKVSGVLSCVSASLVLADNMWPWIVHKESMEHVWHTFEYLGNTMIFFIAGSITGTLAKEIWLRDYIHMIVVYIVCVAIRALLIFGSRPYLRHLDPNREPVSVQDALVMTWGGLRGAVGLALAIQVKSERAGGRISDYTSKMVLFFVGGVATLTLVINATTSPALVRKLGITKTGAERRQLLMQVHEALVASAHELKQSKPVRDLVEKLLVEAREKLTEQTKDRNSSSEWLRGLRRKHTMMEHEEIVDDLDSARKVRDRFGAEKLKLLGHAALKRSTFEQGEAQYLAQIDAMIANPGMVRAVRDVFLSLVRSQYWKQIEAGDFALESQEDEVLINSINYALHHTSRGLEDFEYIAQRYQIPPDFLVGKIDSKADEDDEEAQQVDFLASLSPGQCISELTSLSVRHIQESLERMGAEACDTKKGQLRCRRMADSFWFSTLISLAIAGSAITLAAEWGSSSAENRHRDIQHGVGLAWYCLDIMFVAIFACECIVKISAQRMKYFEGVFNRIDFFITVVGAVSLVVEGALVGNQNVDSLRLLNVLRLTRVIRLISLARGAHLMIGRLQHKKISLVLARHVEKITVLTAFCRAHVESQKELVRYFGADGATKTVEVARCLAESQRLVYLAQARAAWEVGKTDVKVLKGISLMRQSLASTEELVHFIKRAHSVGALNNREAEALIHPLEDHQQRVQLLFDEQAMGIHSLEFEEIADSYESQAGSNRSTLIELQASNINGDADATVAEQDRAPELNEAFSPHSSVRV